MHEQPIAFSNKKQLRHCPLSNWLRAGRARIILAPRSKDGILNEDVACPMRARGSGPTENRMYFTSSYGQRGHQAGAAGTCPNSGVLSECFRDPINHRHWSMNARAVRTHSEVVEQRCEDVNISEHRSLGWGKAARLFLNSSKHEADTQTIVEE